MKTILIIAFLFLTLIPPAMANDCSTARNVSGGGCHTEFLDNVCDFGPANQNGCTNCGGDAWYEYIPGGNNLTQHNVRFTIGTNFTGNINLQLVYSESVDAGDPCQWNTNTQGYTRYNTACNIPVAVGGTTYNFDCDGLDGSGHFFLVVERVGSSVGNVTVCFQELSTCSAPVNDRCSTPTALGIGSGIDQGTVTGTGNGSWTDAISVSNVCATKQRMNNVCGSFSGPNPTEDHYGRRFLGACFFNGNVGDNGAVPTGNQCDQFLENTVYYSFQVPVTANNWFVHIGSEASCPQQPNFMVGMLLDNLDCANARNTNRMECTKFTVSGNLPTPDHTFAGPGGTGNTFVAGQTYFLVFDGTRNSQCNLKVLLTRSQINPLLPVAFLTFEGKNQDISNQLEWVVDPEENLDYFEVEYSSDGQDFQYVHTVEKKETGGFNLYTFEDNPVPSVRFYRIKAIDLDGGFFYSEILHVTRKISSLKVYKIYPNPFDENLHITLGIPSKGILSWKLTDITGRTLLHNQRQISPQETGFQIETRSLPAGMYIWVAQFGPQTFNRKIIKL